MKVVFSLYQRLFTFKNITDEVYIHTCSWDRLEGAYESPPGICLSSKVWEGQRVYSALLRMKGQSSSLQLVVYSGVKW